MRVRCFALMGLWLFLGMWLCAGVAAGEAERISFTSFRDALQQGANQKRVTAVYFTADWCGWCLKMHSSTFTDAKVLALSRQFSWAKVDIDDEPAVAAQFGVPGVPALTLLNAKGELLTMRRGYLTPRAMAVLLERYATQAEAPGRWRQRRGDVSEAVTKLQQLQFDASSDEKVVEAVVLLSKGDRHGRKPLQQAIVKAGPATWSALLRCAKDDRLAVRAAAYDLLLSSTGAKLPFDPFAEPPKRKVQIEAWRDWIEQHSQTS